MSVSGALVEDGDDLSQVSPYPGTVFLLTDVAIVKDGDDLSQLSPYFFFTHRCRFSKGWR